MIRPIGLDVPVTYRSYDGIGRRQFCQQINWKNRNTKATSKMLPAT